MGRVTRRWGALAWGWGSWLPCKRNYPVALEHFEAAVELYESGYGDDAPQLVGVLTNLGNVYNAIGKQPQSLAAHERALRILERVHGRDDLQLAAPLHNAAYALDALGRREQARSYHRRALDLESAALGEDHVEVAISKVILAGALADDNDHEQAQRLVHSALPKLVDVLGPTHFIVGLGRSTRGRALAGLGRREEAKLAFEGALAALESPEVDPEDRGRAKLGLAKVLWEDRAERGRATSLGRDAVMEFERADSPDPQQVEAARSWVPARRGSVAPASAALGQVRGTLDV